MFSPLLLALTLRPNFSQAQQKRMLAEGPPTHVKVGFSAWYHMCSGEGVGAPKVLNINIVALLASVGCMLKKLTQPMAGVIDVFQCREGMARTLSPRWRARAGYSKTS